LLLEDKEVFNLFKLEAKALGRKVFTDGENYMFIKGSERICLVAHVDTVNPFTGKVGKSIKERYGILTAWKDRSDKKKERTILGADDRAGCYGLLQIMKEDSRPSLLLTNYEERGGRGATVFTQETELWKNFDFMVELDRAGCNEYVQYTENSHEVHSFIAQFGIANGGSGSYSDIATISRATKLPAVNIAIGYRAQHSDREYLDLAAMELGIQKTRLIVHRYCKDKPQLGLIKEKDWGPKTEPIQLSQTVYTWKPSNKEAIKCIECGGADGEHYRSCIYFDDNQSSFHFGND
jgi:hypothetical protein